MEKRTYLSDDQRSIEVGIPDIAVLTQLPDRGTAVATRSQPTDCIMVTLPVPQEVREGYLEIRDVATGRVITVVEVLSPTNKRPGRGRDAYEEKRAHVLSSPTHLVELDLLRSGTPPLTIGPASVTDYRLLVGRKEHRPQAQLYGFNLQQPIPSFSLPLAENDQEPIVNLHNLLNEIYDQAGFDLAIDYTSDPNPPLKASDREWANKLLQTQKLRDY